MAGENILNKKKESSTNFTVTEIDILMKCVFQEIRIIENRKSDSITLKEKQEAWSRVALLFNSANTTNRDVNSLKLKYENIKRNLKKKITSSKNCLRKTGGVLQLNIDGLNSFGDSDSNKTNTADTQSCIVLDHGYAEVGESSSTIYIFDKNEEIDENQPLDSILQPISTNKSLASTLPLANKNKWNLRKRRNVTMPAEKKQENLESFQKLAKSKTDLAEIQQDCYKIELKLKQDDIKNKQNEWEVRKQVLDVELKMKQEEYKETLRETSRKRNLYNLMEEEQKLKIEILKCELNCKLNAFRVQPTNN